jgi:hypothetical protein
MVTLYTASSHFLKGNAYYSSFRFLILKSLAVERGCLLQLPGGASHLYVATCKYPT